MRLKWFAVAVAPVLAPACFSSSDSPPGPDGGTPHVDAGPTPVVDATMPSGPDAAAPEATTLADAYVAETSLPEATVEAGPPLVTVVVHSALGPESGVTVVFHDASGAVLSTATTGALGSASALVPAGSQVTAVMGTVVSPKLTTIQGVAPGDVLAIYDPSNDATGAQLLIDLPIDGTPPAGSAYFFVQIGQCSYGFSAFPFSLNLNSLYDCEAQGQFPILVVAQAGADGGYADIGYLYQKGNLVAPDGGVASVTLTGSWSTTLGTQTLAVANAPLSGVSVSLGEVTGNVSTPTSYTQVLTDDAGVASYVFPTHPGFASSLQGEAAYSTGAYSASGGYAMAVSGVATRGPAAQGDASVSTFDFAGTLPLIDHASLDSSNPAQPVVAWASEGGALAPADGVFVSLTWNDATDAGASIVGRWTIVAPPASSSVTAPALPAAAQPWAPGPAATLGTIPSVVVVDADFIADYAALRAQAGSLPISSNLLNGRSSPAAPALPVDGTLKLTAFTLSGD